MFPWRSKKVSSEVPRRRTVQDAPGDYSVSTNEQFKRNRTLSSYRHDVPEESTRRKAHHLAVQRRKVGGLFMIASGVVATLLLLLWQLMAQINVATSTKQLAASFQSEAYERSINGYLGLNPAQRLRGLLDSKALSRYVASELPEVEQVELKGGLGSVARGTFSITFRTPVAGWQINGKQYYVDASGVVFERNYYEAPTVSIVDESGVTPEEGTAVASGRLLGFLGKSVAAAKGRGYTVVKAALPQGTTRTVDLYFEGIATRARLTVDRGAGEQVEDFDRSYKYMTSRGIGAEYVDVRVSGRSVYR